MKLIANSFTKTLLSKIIPFISIALAISTASFCQVSWVQVPSPDTSASRNMLRGISGTSSTDIWAVGSFEEIYDFNPYYVEKELIMHWNGSAWHIYPPLNLSTTLNDLWDVEALATNNVWAAGTYNDPGNSRAELIHFNGTSWTQQALPLITGGSFLFSLSAISATDIWSVGGKAGSPTSPAYTIHYNGSTWTEKPVPPVGSYHNLFNAVDGLTANDVWAVGYHGETRGDYHTLAMHWNGSTWTNFPLPSAVDNNLAELLNVKMIAANDVWAVGSSLTGQLLMVHWNGSSWSETTHNGGGGAFAAISSNNLFAVGGEISHWNGNAWTIVDSLKQLSYPSLVSTKVFANGDIWTCGRTVNGDNSFHSLVYRSVPNNSPVFVRGAAQNWNVVGNSGNNSIDSLLKTQFGSSNQTLSYSVSTSAAHGSLTGFPKNAVTNNGFATPSGLGYTPATGYTGSDQFVIKVLSGTLYALTTINVNICKTPTVSVAANGPVTFCVPGNVTLTATVNGTPVTYQWKLNGVAINGANNSNIVASSTGNYLVSVFNACGIASSNSISITANPLPNVSINPGGTVTICKGTKVTLSVPAASNQTYQWKKNNVNITGATNANYKASAAGTFNVVVTKTTTGCTATSPGTIVKKINCAKESNKIVVRREKTITAEPDDIVIYPNPFHFAFFLKGLTNHHYDLIVSDITGRTILIISDVNEHTVLGDQLKTGVYFVSITSGTEKIKTLKLVKF